MLVIELGAINTRALLFDVVAGQYRFLGAGTERSTHGAPYFSVIESALRAIRRLEEICGRDLLDNDAELILPADNYGRGVDHMALIFSGEPDLRTALFGLLDEVSLASLQRLAGSIPGRAVARFSLADRRPAEEQLSELLRASPHLVLLGGGSDNGASASVERMINMLWLALQAQPSEERPAVLYAGNQAMADQAEVSLGALTRVYMAANIRPSLDQEDLGQAQEKAARVVSDIALRQVPGLRALAEVGRCRPVPLGNSFGRMVRHLSQIPDCPDPILGVHLDRTGAVLASARQGQLKLLHHTAGVGAQALASLAELPLQETLDWLDEDLQPDVVRDHLYNQVLYPASLPATDEAMWVELAAARSLLRRAIDRLRALFPGEEDDYRTVVLSGAWFGRYMSPEQALHLALDSLQPAGMTTILLDRHGLLPALGASAERSSLIPAQLLDSSVMMRLGTVFAPVIEARPGIPILEACLEREQGNEMCEVVQQGSITILPLETGQNATLHLRPQKGVKPDARISKGRSYRVTGSRLGIVIDARGRPLSLPGDESKRRELLRSWESVISPQTTP